MIELELLGIYPLTTVAVGSSKRIRSSEFTITELEDYWNEKYDFAGNTLFFRKSKQYLEQLAKSSFNRNPFIVEVDLLESQILDGYNFVETVIEKSRFENNSFKRISAVAALWAACYRKLGDRYRALQVNVAFHQGKPPFLDVVLDPSSRDCMKIYHSLIVPNQFIRLTPHKE